MINRTGRAMGTLDPIVYFENSRGEIMLPPTTKDARWLYEVRYSKQGWQWKEAGTLSEVDRLQNRLIEIETRKDELAYQREEQALAPARERIRSNLVGRMVSAATSQYERDYIDAWLNLRDEKKKKAYEQRFNERRMYLHVREFDSNTKGTDRMKSEEGDRWERE